MSIDLVWRVVDTNLTHHAIILGDDLNDQEVRTACGLSLSVMSGEAVEADAEITCSVCNHHETPKATCQHPQSNGRKHCRKVSSPPVKANAPLPYGIFHVDPRLVIDRGPPERVRCCIRGCSQMLIPPSRWRPGEVCPEHGIRIHTSQTYSYIDPRRNIIVAHDVFARRLLHNSFKWEGTRYQNECGEDSLSWNVLRSFYETQQLHLIARYVTGRDVSQEPTLYLWGLEQTADQLLPWDLLIAARERFEVGKINKDRPFSEPDGALVIPGKVFIIVESKFTSPNTFITDGPRKTAQSLSKDEVLTMYEDRTNQMIDPAKARATPMLMGQLYRYAILGQFMASLAGPGTEFYLCNLTRAFHENQSFEAFARLVRPEYQHRICHLRWEDLFVLAGLSGGRLRRLQQYLLTKTANLKPAFTLGYW